MSLLHVSESRSRTLLLPDTTRGLVSVLRGKIKKAFFKYGVQVPESYRAATRLDNSERDGWILEMNNEIEALMELGAFKKGFHASRLPDGIELQDVIESIWVYDVKVDGRKRARFAARGDMETHQDDDDNFSPVTQMRTVRLILAVAAQLNLELVTMDFPKAFLLGKMDKTKPIFMHAPEGFGERGEVWQICLPLYGLTVSSRRFYESLSEFMRSIGFQHFAGGDPCLFRRPRLMPSPQEAVVNNYKSIEVGLQGRPLIPNSNPVQIVDRAFPRAPLASQHGPPIKPKYPYPDFMEHDDYKDSPNVAFEPFHAAGLAPDALNGLFPNSYYEMAAVYVDDLIGATHHAAELAEAFVKRFGAKVSPPGSMYIGMNYHQNMDEGWISIGFQTCLDRTMEKI